MDLPFRLGLPPGRGEQDRQLRQAQFQASAIAAEGAQTLGMVGQLGAVNPGQEGSIQVAARAAENLLEHGPLGVAHPRIVQCAQS
ncbi:hypothetical protein D3C78_1741360 [compost metagenome]